MKLYCLFEHSTGYALLKIDEVEEIGSLLETVTESRTRVGYLDTWQIKQLLLAGLIVKFYPGTRDKAVLADPICTLGAD